MRAIRTMSLPIIASATIILTACGAASVAAPTRSPRATHGPTASATPAPAPTPSTITAPVTEDDADNGAKYAIMRYDAVADDAAGGRASDALISLVATGSAAGDLEKANRQSKGAVSGHSVFSFVDWSIGDLVAADGATIPRGRVTLTGCIDKEPRTGAGASTAADTIGVSEERFEIDYSPAAKRWMVSTVTAADAGDCAFDDVTSEVNEVQRIATAFSAAEVSIGQGANGSTTAAGIAKGRAADILSKAEPGALGAAGSSGFEVRFIAHYPPDGSVPAVDDAADVFGCLSAPKVLYFDASAQMWPPGDFGYLDVAHVTTDDHLYVTGLAYTPDDECEY